MCLTLVMFQVSIFLKDKVQSTNGKFVLTTDGAVPWDSEVPGAIRQGNIDLLDYEQSPFFSKAARNTCET